MGLGIPRTKELVGSNVNAILTRQTCGQRSCMSVRSKLRAPAFYFSVRIWYMFKIPKCRRKSDLGLHTALALAQGMWLRSAEFRLKNVFGHKICRKSALRSSIFFASAEVVHTSKLDSPIHFDPQNICQICMATINASAQRLPPAALLERWPHVCRVKITSHYYRRIVSFPQQRIR